MDFEELIFFMIKVVLVIETLLRFWGSVCPWFRNSLNLTNHSFPVRILVGKEHCMKPTLWCSHDSSNSGKRPKILIPKLNEVCTDSV